MKPTLTLDRIESHGPLESYWYQLKTSVDFVREQEINEPLNISDILNATNLEFALWCLRCLPEDYWKDIYDLAMDYYNIVKPKFLEMNPLADCDGKVKEAKELVKDCKSASNLIVAFSQNAIKAKAYLETGVHDFMPFVPDDYLELKYKNDQIIIAETETHEEMLVNQFG